MRFADSARDVDHTLRQEILRDALYTSWPIAHLKKLPVDYFALCSFDAYSPHILNS